jgi:hypothetical protein
MANVYCFDWENCGKDHVIGAFHKDPKHPGVYMITCCSGSHEVISEDLIVREKSDAEIAVLGPVTSGSWV